MAIGNAPMLTVGLSVVTCQQCGMLLEIRDGEESVSCLGGKHFATRRITVSRMPDYAANLNRTNRRPS